MRLHRKTLLSVGGSCLSAAGGRRGGRYMWGLRERTHPRSYSACRTLKGHSHSCIYNISASPHLQQLLVLVSTGKGLRASERGQKKRFSTFESKTLIFNLFVFVKYILFGVSVSLMADTVFRADFRGSWTLETTGLKDEDSSVEIYTENTLTQEKKDKNKNEGDTQRTNTHARKRTGQHR